MRLFGVSVLVAAFFSPLFASAAFPPPTCQMSVTPSVIRPGDSVALKWSSTNASSTTITGVGSVPTSGQVNLAPPLKPSTTFTGTFVGAGGTRTCQATVNVYSGSSGGIEDPGAESSGSGSGGVSGTLPSIISSPGDGSSGGSATSPSAPTLNPTPAPFIDRPPEGLVSCRGADDCNLCAAGKLIQNIILFMIGIAIPIATLLFAWAGVLYFSSGANPSGKDKAKQIFVDAFIGFIVAIGAFLIINTILNVLLDKNQFAGGNWFNISCQTGPRLGTTGNFKDINQLLQSVLPSLSVVQSPQGTTFDNRFNAINQTAGSGLGGDSCGTGYYYTADAEEYWCQNNSGDIQEARFEVTERGTCADGYNYSENETEYWCQSATNPDVTNENNWQETTDFAGGFNPNPVVGACDPDVVANAATAGGYNLSYAQAQTLACLAGPESSCGTNTSIPRTPEGRTTTATGAWQIVLGLNTECHNLNLSICTQAAQNAGYNVQGNLNCSQYFSGGRPRAGYEYYADACKAAAWNIECNASAAACLVSKNSSFSDWVADPRSGAQAACINRYN